MQPELYLDFVNGVTIPVLTHTLKPKHSSILYFHFACLFPLHHSPFQALPVLFKHWLKNEEVEEGRTAVLHCELTKPNARVEWRKGNTVLHSNDKYEIRQEGTHAELFIYDAEAQDAGDYTCDSGDQQTTASLQVKGRRSLAWRQRIYSCGCPP